MSHLQPKASRRRPGLTKRELVLVMSMLSGVLLVSLVTSMDRANRAARSGPVVSDPTRQAVYDPEATQAAYLRKVEAARAAKLEEMEADPRFQAITALRKAACSVEYVGHPLPPPWRPSPSDYKHPVNRLLYNRNHLKDADLIPLRQIPELKCLDFGDGITDAGLIHLQSVPQLESLIVCASQVSDDGLIFLKFVPHLRLLQLDRTRITDAGLVHLEQLPELRQLSLNNTHIEGAGLVHLKELKNLNSLALCETSLSDAGLVQLGELTQLKELLLSRTLISDAGLVYLKGLTQLNFIFLDGTHVRGAGIQELQTALPNCKIVHSRK